MPSAAITYACLDYLSRGVDGSKTVTLTRLASDPGAPGRIMKLTEQDIADAIQESAASVGHLRLVRPAGSRQLAINASPSDVAFEVLAARHQQRSSNLPGLPDFELVGSAATAAYLTKDEIDRAVRKAERSRKQRRGDAA